MFYRSLVKTTDPGIQPHTSLRIKIKIEVRYVKVLESNFERKIKLKEK